MTYNNTLTAALVAAGEANLKTAWKAVGAAVTDCRIRGWQTGVPAHRSWIFGSEELKADFPPCWPGQLSQIAAYDGHGLNIRLQEAVYDAAKAAWALRRLEEDAYYASL